MRAILAHLVQPPMAVKMEAKAKECDQLRVSILSVRDTQEKVIIMEGFHPMKTIPYYRNEVLQKVPRCENYRAKPFFGSGVLKMALFANMAVREAITSFMKTRAWFEIPGV